MKINQKEVDERVKKIYRTNYKHQEVIKAKQLTDIFTTLGIDKVEA